MIFVAEFCHVHSHNGGKCMIFVTDSGRGKCMIFVAETFLVHTMEGKCLVFIADNGKEVQDFCC